LLVRPYVGRVDPGRLAGLHLQRDVLTVYLEVQRGR
jgi:hypothetical protein